MITVGVSISPDRLRQINDPISILLGQLHKLIHITQVGGAKALLAACIAPIAGPWLNIKQSTSIDQVVCEEIVFQS